MSTITPPPPPPTTEPTNHVSTDQVLAFLHAHYGPGIADLAPIAHGEWSAAFTFRHDGADRVVRFGDHPDDFARDRYAAAYSSPVLPVPRILEIGEALGRHFAVSERAFGAYLDHLDEGQMRRTLPALFAALDAARAVPLPPGRFGGLDENGLAPFPTWRDHLLAFTDEPGRTGGWRANLAASPTGSGPFDDAYAALQTLISDDPITPHLIHSDLLNFNVLVDGDRPSAFLDWGCATAGDHLYDLAWLLFYQPWYPAWAAIDFRAEARRHHDATGLDVPGFDRRLRCCQIHIGLGHQAYNAFIRRWPSLEDGARRTLAVAHAP